MLCPIPPSPPPGWRPLLLGCDVLLRPDDEPSLHLFLVRGRSVREFTTLDGSSSSSVLRQMKVHSLQGCAQLPGANCSRRCRVTVGIPPSASSASSASVTVFQHAFDTGPHSRDVGALSTAPHSHPRL